MWMDENRFYETGIGIGTDLVYGDLAFLQWNNYITRKIINCLMVCVGAIEWSFGKIKLDPISHQLQNNFTWIKRFK